MPGLRDAMGALYARSLAAARAARPLADLLHDDFLPASLRAAPAAVQPYLIARDTFVQRLYTEHAGYWQANGDGIDAFTRVEWAGALEALGGGGDAPFVRTARELEARGDAGLALQIAELGLARHPASAALRESPRARADHVARRLFADQPLPLHRLLGARRPRAGAGHFAVTCAVIRRFWAWQNSESFAGQRGCSDP